MPNPIDLLSAVAVQVEAASGIRAVADRAPVAWREDGAPFVTVIQPTPFSPALTGAGSVLTDTTTVQVSLWEDRAVEDPTRVDDLVAALDGVRLPGDGVAGRVVGVLRLPDPEADVIQSAIDVRYHRRR